MWNALKTWSVAYQTNETEKVTMCERQSRGSGAGAGFAMFESGFDGCLAPIYSIYMDTPRRRCVCHPLWAFYCRPGAFSLTHKLEFLNFVARGAGGDEPEALMKAENYS